MQQIQFFNNKKTQTARGTINSTSRVYHNLRKFKQNALIKGTTNYNKGYGLDLSLRPLTSICTCLKPYFAKHNGKTIYCGNYKQKIPPA